MGTRSSAPVNTLLRQALTLTALKAARDKVLTNNGCPGVDGVSVLDFAAQGDVALRVLAADILGQRYQPQPLRRLWLPREGKPPRGLAVPVVRDRIAQTALATALAPLAEAHAQDSSFAYRKGRSVQQAVARVERLMREGWRWVVEPDIEHFFDEITHDQVMAELAALMPHEHDARSLIRGWLMAPVKDEASGDGPLQPTRRGVPQGSPISPLLANLVLDSLDQALLDNGHCLVRFADDFLILARSQERAQEGLALSRELLERLALRLNPSKTRVIHSDQGFEFLGWHFVRTLAWPKQHDEAPPEAIAHGISVPNPIPTVRPEPVEGPEAGTLPHTSPVRPEPVEGPDPTLDPNVSNAAAAAEPWPTPEPDDEAAPPAEDADSALPALAPLQRTLYLVDPQVELGVDKQRLVVRKGERTLLAVSALNVDQVMVFGPVQVSTQALQLISRSGGAVGFLSQLGRYYGRYEGADGSALGLLEAQFQRAQEPDFALAVARRLVATKLRNSATVLARTLRRHATQQPQHHDAAHAAPARLREWADATERAPDPASLRGTEGAGAALYFQTLGQVLPPAWGFSSRQARPAPDPVNALLSFGYSVLYQAVAGLLRARGLHAHLGLFHATGGAHMALASDLMEPYRAYAVDAPVLRLLFEAGGIQPDDGSRDGPAWRLGAATQRALIHAIETRFNTPMQHPQSQEPMDLRRLIDADVRQLSTALRSGQVGEFWPAHWR